MKYMGSKASIASFILPYIHNYMMLTNINTYIEPFVGGANMIDKVQCTNKIGYDINKYLIEMFNHLQQYGSSELPENIDREKYDDCREHWRMDDGYYEDWYLGIVGFLASFNGKFFEGGYAQNVWENGKCRNYYAEARDNLIEQLPSLRGIQFKVSDYRDLEIKNSIIYCDPPYMGTTEYNKGSKSSKKFNSNEFWDKMREWSNPDNNNIVLISEEQGPEDFDIIWEKEITRTLNAQNKNIASEKLFIYHDLNKDAVPQSNDEMFDF